MGGGALMTPLLVLVFKVQPMAAISSDLVVALLMKPIGGYVHSKRGTVHRPLVLWLIAGSVPAALVGSILVGHFGHGSAGGAWITPVLGIALLITAVGIPARQHLARRHRVSPATEAVAVRPLATLSVGVLGGLLVGITSVGSGSLMMVLLLLLYPRLSARELVGTDLVQAVPLVAAAALGHVLFGEVSFGLTASLAVGAIPGVYLGARASVAAPDRLVRSVLTVVLMATGLHLLHAPTLLVIGAAAGVGVASAIFGRGAQPADAPADDRTISLKVEAESAAATPRAAPPAAAGELLSPR